MIKISYAQNKLGTVHSQTFDTWDEAQEYCSKQDRRSHLTDDEYNLLRKLPHQLFKPINCKIIDLENGLILITPDKEQK